MFGESHQPVPISGRTPGAEPDAIAPLALIVKDPHAETQTHTVFYFLPSFMGTESTDPPNTGLIIVETKATT